jgi:adenylate cyclase
MFTDLVGFTALAQRNEAAALALLDRHNRLVRSVLPKFHGTEVKTMGDAFLVEFESALDAVLCALEIQSAVRRPTGAAEGNEEPIVLRIGVHLGDVVHSGTDILGDAVNVASRIEPLAEPGGICISGAVYDQVRNKVDLPLEKLGVRELKNVAHPVDVYRVVMPGGALQPRHPAAGTPSHLRLAVLPFANMSPDPNDDYFADGLTDELITQTSRIPNLRVIARTSVLRYKGSTKSVREVAQELGVRLALEGTVRKAGRHVRVTVTLVDPRSEEHLWSSRYDRPLDDIFAIQDDIAGQVASSISLHVPASPGPALPAFAHGVPDTDDLEAYTSFLRGRKLFADKASEESIRQALSLFESAVRRDPRFARARVGIADCVTYLATEGALPYVEALERAHAELATALGLNEGLAEAHSVLAGVLLGEDQIAGTEREARRAMELNPSLSDPYRWLAQIRAGTGRMDEAVRLLEAAQQVDPLDVNIVAFLGRAYAYAGREAEALAYWERTKQLVPFRTNAHLTEYYLGHGDYAKAEETLREMERLRPTSVWVEMYRGILAARRGDSETARRVIERLERRGRTGELTVFHRGFIYLALGDVDAFVACMEEAFRLHSLPLLEIQYSTLADKARSDPRIVDLLRRQLEFHAPAGAA